MKASKWTGKWETAWERYEGLSQIWANNQAVWPITCQIEQHVQLIFIVYRTVCEPNGWCSVRWKRTLGKGTESKLQLNTSAFFAADCIPSVSCCFWLLILYMVALTSGEIIVGLSPDSYSGMISSVSEQLTHNFIFYGGMWRMADYQLGNMYFSPGSDFCHYWYNYWRKQGFKLHTAYYRELNHHLFWIIIFLILLEVVMQRR